MTAFKKSSPTQRCLRVCGPVYLLFLVTCLPGYFYQIDFLQSAWAWMAMPAHLTALIMEQVVAEIMGGRGSKWNSGVLYISYAAAALVWIVCALSPWWLFVRMTWGKRLCLQVAILVAGYVVSMFLVVFLDFPSPN